MISIKQSGGHFFSTAIKPKFTVIELKGGNPINLCIVLIKLYTRLDIKGGNSPTVLQ